MIYSVKVFQLKDSDNLHFHRFASLKELKKYNLNLSINNYNLIYTTEKDFPMDMQKIDILEKLFSEFQGAKPKGYNGHSLSVSDIIKLNDEYWYCDSFGFEKLDF